ncbi:MAG: tetraacyldisaccharide 4'-kinase [Bacteroidales bacterium]|nr:tetraacyldisaccharide 4'-kinase [Candidatus Physcousia equi]
MEGNMIMNTRWMMPLSWIYGGVTKCRNWLFDIGVLKSQQYQIPVISVGNLTVGGTGKTPHVEYLIRLLLREGKKVAVLSRGYKRKTHGYLLASAKSTMQDIGDEPWQVKQKFPNVYVAVDGNRRRGIERLTSDPTTNNVEVILLDDAFQHRYVKPTLNILLIDYHHMITDDCLLPAGRLRESAKGKQRAQLVIVTKCPADMTPMDYRVVLQNLHLRPYQSLFFSTFRYGELQGLFNKRTRPLHSIENDEHVLLLTGIASPEQMKRDLHRYTRHIDTLSFPDHHFFTPKDATIIEERLRRISPPRLIITTEKDATRLRLCTSLSEFVRQAIYILPIEVEIKRDEQDKFNKEIISKSKLQASQP